MTGRHTLAARAPGEYLRQVRALLHLLLLMSVALLPLTSLAARAGTAADLTSSAVELEQAPLPGPGHKTPPAQEHRHCTIWAAEAEACLALSDRLALALPGAFASPAPHSSSSGPQAPTPPPKF